MIKVRVKKSALDYFRFLARNTPLEIEAYLVGEIVSPSLTVVSKFFYTKDYYEQKTNEVRWKYSEVERVQKYAEEHGQRILGTLHSHPEWDAVPSKDDYEGQIKECHRILGICSTMGRKTRVRFWVADSSLPCKIEYIGEK